MHIEKNSIILGILPNEPVVITDVKRRGSTSYSISYSGINTKTTGNKIIAEATFNELSTIAKEGEFYFGGDPTHFKLYVDAERIRTAYQFDPLFAVNCSIVDPLPHQIDAVYNVLLPLPKIRFLLADDTGAGKTIMTSLLIKELMMRGNLKRVLIITPGGLTKQWQEDELGLKFNLHFKLVDRAAFNSDPNIFQSADCLVTSIDFIRKDVLNVLKNTTWDMIVVDEAHKLSAYEYGDKKQESARYEAMRTLAPLCEHLLLLTATPHRGRYDTFRNLLQLLDPDIFSSDETVTNRIQEVTKKGINKFFIRRLKENMRDWDGKPLFKKRLAKTVEYALTEQEKKLYDEVTRYLTDKKEAAKSNRQVTMALMVMQRRLTSSIFAIKKTLKNRLDALNALLELLKKEPNLFDSYANAKNKIDTPLNLDEIDELDDIEKEELQNNIITDPKKFKLFTTAKSPKEIQAEANEVKQLYEIAEELFKNNEEEQKYLQLNQFLEAQGVPEYKEKLVIFTEYKDTLEYLAERLRKQGKGYKVVTIHGGKNVDERRQAQIEFAKPDTQILIATDAAGEGINLQFCSLLLNWDIPWNPNRLEQRMGRIHRYGQKKDVMVFNLVAKNTREGKVLSKILSKLEIMREQLGDDRVYDVISDVFQDITLQSVIDAVFNNKSNAYIQKLDSSDHALALEFKKKIEQQTNTEQIIDSPTAYREAKMLKEESDEKRLQPIYVRVFFEKAFKALGGEFVEDQYQIFTLTKLPAKVSARLKSEYKMNVEVTKNLFCFDKNIFLEFKTMPVTDTQKLPLHYINPGNPIFDTVLNVVLDEFRLDALKGTILVAPNHTTEALAFLVKSKIRYENPLPNSNDYHALVDESLSLVCMDASLEPPYQITSAALLMDLLSPIELAMPITPPQVIKAETIIDWCYQHITEPQLLAAQNKTAEDIEQRKLYLMEAFTELIFLQTEAINELQKELQQLDNSPKLKKIEDQIKLREKQKRELQAKREQRLQEIDNLKELYASEPEILGCVYIVPLTRLEYKKQFGMERDDEVEAIAMQVALQYEHNHHRTPEDCAKQNLGFDIRSIDPDTGAKRYIEVKGRAQEGNIMLTENEYNRLAQLGDTAWLYVVLNCRNDNPDLHIFQNPIKQFEAQFQTLSKGVQFLLPLHSFKPEI